ncbi:MAG: hypothetical protein AAF564_24740 [Bacteroidota bacterium]
MIKANYIGMVFLCFCFALPAQAQDSPMAPPAPAAKSAQKAFALSLILPGWGHRYAQDGSWRGRATLHAGADLGLWIGLVSAEWRKNHFIQSYQTLAATSGNAIIEGKDRAFYLNLASFQSSDEYLTFQLRNRAWDRIDYVDDPAFHWNWDTSDDFQQFRELREDAESLSRRRSIFIALLVANRVLAGLSAIQAANKSNVQLTASFSAPPSHRQVPVLNLGLRF